MAKHNFRQTKYYKKVWGAFSSPILNAQNYANYVTDTNIADVYKLFDGDASTYVYLGSSSPVYYVNMKFPSEIDITNFVLSAQRYNPAWCPSSVKFYAKTNGTWSYLGGFDNGSIAWEGGLNMSYSLNNHIVSKEIRIEIGGGTLVGGGISYSAYALELSFTGQQITSIIEISEAEYEANKDNSDYFKVDRVAVKNYLASQNKYLKKVTVEKSWTQPVLTSNGTLGGNSFAVADDGHYDSDISGDAWLLFNPTTGKSSQSLWSWAGTKTPGGITIYNPIPLKITNIQVTNHSWANASVGAGYGITGGIIQASNDNSTWVNLKTFTNSVVALSETWNIDLSDNTNAYKYYRLWITSHSSSAYAGRNYIGLLTITATQQTQGWQECTKAQYDQQSSSNRRIENRYMAQVGKKYLKKVSTIIEIQFQQPLMSSSSDNGTLGGSKFACTLQGAVSGYDNPYLLFNGSGSASISATTAYYGSATTTITLYNPIPLNITQLTLQQGGSNAYGGLHSGTVYGSNDNINWVYIADYSGLTANAGLITEYINLQDNTEFYKYYQIRNTTGGTHGVVLSEITITATQKIQTVTSKEVTKAEFDQLPDAHKYIENVNYIAKVA